MLTTTRICLLILMPSAFAIQACSHPKKEDPLKTAERLKYCRLVFESVKPGDDQCSRFMDQIALERRKEASNNTVKPIATGMKDSAGYANTTIREPVEVNGEIALECPWSGQESLFVSATGVNESKPTSGKASVVINKKNSSIIVDGTRHSLKDDGRIFRWSTESVENNVGKMETTKNSSMGSINRETLSFSVLQLYTVDGGTLRYFSSRANKDGSCSGAKPSRITAKTKI